jgi:polyhydroxyalkanoate synthesis regulator phasin
MTPEEIKEVVRDVLREQKLATQPDLDSVVYKTIATLLTSFGIEEADRVELKADFHHLRRWRKSVEQAQSYTFKIVITTIVTGFLGALWLGVQSFLHK